MFCSFAGRNGGPASDIDTNQFTSQLFEYNSSSTGRSRCKTAGGRRPNGHPGRRLFTMCSKYFWCNLIYTSNMGRRNCRRHLWIFNCSFVLLCGKFPFSVVVNLDYCLVCGRVKVFRRYMVCVPGCMSRPVGGKFQQQMCHAFEILRGM